jgi:hypothetical protein
MLQPDQAPLLLFALSASLTALDVHSSFKCIREVFGCHEANPLMRPFIGPGKSQAAAHAYTQGVNLGLNALGWKLRRGNNAYWWIPATVTGGMHGAAASWNFNLGEKR